MVFIIYQHELATGIHVSPHPELPPTLSLWVLPEWVLVSSKEGGGPGADYTEWSKSERKRQILKIKAHIWNLERWYQWSYMQGSRGDTDVKNRLLDSAGKGEGGMIWENSTETCTLSYVKWMTGASFMHEAELNFLHGSFGLQNAGLKRKSGRSCIVCYEAASEIILSILLHSMY